MTVTRFALLRDHTARDCSACNKDVTTAHFYTEQHNIACAKDGERSYKAAWTTGRPAS